MEYTCKSLSISDIHLTTKNCKATYLDSYLKKHKPEKLFIVGDFIDVWRMISNGIYTSQDQMNVIRRILSLARKGTKVYYITGNHDEFLRPLINDFPENFKQFGNITICNEYSYQGINGKKYLILHGDQYDFLVRHSIWITNKAYRFYSFLLTILHFFDNIRRKLKIKKRWSLSKTIKEQSKNFAKFINNFEKLITKDVKERKFDGVICGHIHKAEIKNINDIEYMNTGCWTEFPCTALIEDFDGNWNIEIVKE